MNMKDMNITFVKHVLLPISNCLVSYVFANKNQMVSFVHTAKKWRLMVLMILDDVIFKRPYQYKLSLITVIFKAHQANHQNAESFYRRKQPEQWDLIISQSIHEGKKINYNGWVSLSNKITLEIGLKLESKWTISNLKQGRSGRQELHIVSVEAFRESVHQADGNTSTLLVGGHVGIFHMSAQCILRKKLHLFPNKTLVQPIETQDSIASAFS